MTRTCSTRPSRWQRAIAPALLASLFIAAACGGGGRSSPTSPSPANPGPGTGSGRTIQADPSFASVIQEIFERRGCTQSGCHNNATVSGLTLARGASYAALVNVRAANEPIVRVIPGNADGSYLVIKLEGRQAVGARMPLGGAPLDEIDLANIKNWINQGAKNN
jgi:hypothetical protein